MGPTLLQLKWVTRVYLTSRRTGSQPVSFTKEISLKVTEAQIPNFLQHSLMVHYIMYNFWSWKGGEATIATAVQAAHLIPAITGFQTKRDTSGKKDNIEAKRDGIYISYTRHSAYLHSQIQLTRYFSSPTEVNSINHVKMRAISCYT